MNTIQSCILAQISTLKELLKNEERFRIEPLYYKSGILDLWYQDEQIERELKINRYMNYIATLEKLLPQFSEIEMSDEEFLMFIGAFNL